MPVDAPGDDDQGAGMSKKVDEKTDGVVIIDAVGTILMVNKVSGKDISSTSKCHEQVY
jgi:hypothetical protein